jgi:uncharacterized membrane protein
MKTRAELKTKAKKQLSGKIFTILGLGLLSYIVLGLLSCITFGLAAILLTGGIMLSFCVIFLGIANTGRTPQINDLMSGFQEGNFIRSLEGYLRITIFTFLWSLLFIIPGIIKAFAYSQTFFLMADDKKLSAGEAQKKSIAMMKGHKLDLFVLQLSFLPWAILCALTFGLAAIWVIPYTQTTLALFYENLKKA